MLLRTSRTDNGLLWVMPHRDNHLFPPPSLPPFSTTLGCDQDADPNAFVRVPAGLLPLTQVNQPLWVFPGLQSSRQLEKDYHKLMFTLQTPHSHLLKAPYHLPVCKQLERGFLWTELTETLAAERITNTSTTTGEQAKETIELMADTFTTTVIFLSPSPLRPLKGVARALTAREKFHGWGATSEWHKPILSVNQNRGWTVV